MTISDWISGRADVVRAVCEVYGPHIATDVIMASEAAFRREMHELNPPPNLAETVMFAAMILGPQRLELLTAPTPEDTPP